MATILIADDAQVMRRMLASILSRAGHRIVGEAEDGRQAVELYRELKPDLVTMDITMPELDGISAIREILREDLRARIVVFSALDQQLLIVSAIEAGAKDFVVKPFLEGKVVDVVTNVLRGK